MQVPLGGDQVVGPAGARRARRAAASAVCASMVRAHSSAGNGRVVRRRCSRKPARPAYCSEIADEQRLAFGVRAERPAHLGQPVPGGDRVRGEGQVAGDLGDRQLDGRVAVPEFDLGGADPRGLTAVPAARGTLPWCGDLPPGRLGADGPGSARRRARDAGGRSAGAGRPLASARLRPGGADGAVERSVEPAAPATGPPRWQHLSTGPPGRMRRSAGSPRPSADERRGGRGRGCGGRVGPVGRAEHGPSVAGLVRHPCLGCVGCRPVCHGSAGRPPVEGSVVGRPRWLELGCATRHRCGRRPCGGRCLRWGGLLLGGSPGRPARAAPGRAGDAPKRSRNGESMSASSPAVTGGAARPVAYAGRPAGAPGRRRRAPWPGLVTSAGSRRRPAAPRGRCSRTTAHGYRAGHGRASGRGTRRGRATHSTASPASCDCPIGVRPVMPAPPGS